MSEYFIGLDLGQAQDFTAIAIVERAELVGDWDPVLYAHSRWAELRLRYLERMPLGMPYPAVVDRVREVTRSVALRGPCRMAVDATGVGRPVVDLLRKAELGCKLQPVTITGGDTQRSERGMCYVPKRDLITQVQVLLQSGGGLKIAAGLKDGAALAREMSEMRVRVTESGKTQYGVWREGAHDDMVLALALSCWLAKKTCPDVPYGEEGHWRRGDQERWERGFREWGRGR